MRKRAPCRLGVAAAGKKHHPSTRGTDGVKRGSQEGPHWGGPGPRGGGLYRRTMGLATFPTTSERLKRATRKNTMLRGAVNKVSRETPENLSGDPTFVFRAFSKKHQYISVGTVRMFIVS